jgi:hypothetical protein
VCPSPTQKLRENDADVVMILYKEQPQTVTALDTKDFENIMDEQNRFALNQFQSGTGTACPLKK